MSWRLGTESAMMAIWFLAIFSSVSAQQDGDSKPVCVCRNTTFAANISHGLVKTPRYPLSYCGNLNCNWTIVPGSPDEAIRLHWDQFRLSEDDFLMIYFVENGIKVPVEKFSKSYSNLRDFVTPKGAGVELNFVSGGDAVGFPGFLLEFTRFKGMKVVLKRLD